MKKAISFILTVLLTSSILLTNICLVTVHAEQKFGGGSSGGSSSGGGSQGGGSDSSYTPPSDQGGSESSGGSSSGNVDEAAAAWFNEQARIKKEQEAALAALLLQQQMAAQKPKKARKPADTAPKKEDNSGSALSSEINSLKENAASLANAEFADKTPENDLNESTDSAVVTDLTTEAEEITFEEPGEEIDIAAVPKQNISGSTDAAISKYIEDSLVADTSTVAGGESAVTVKRSADKGAVLSKTSKIALVSVLVVVLVIILIIGLVVIMIKKGYWNVEPVDEDLEEMDFGIPVKINAD